ncbi:MAG: carbohydrate binding domain-containing protein, partial [Bacteroidota bacterium]
WIGWGGNPREVVMNNQSAGDYAVRIVGGGAPEQIIDVLPNTDYTLSCMAKVVSGQVALGVKPTDSDNALAAVNISGTDYAEYSVTFNSGPRSQVKIYFFAMAGGNEAFGDEFSVIPTDFDGGMPDPIEYVQFPEAVEFIEFPSITTAFTSIPVRFTYQANTDHELDLVLRAADGAEISRMEYDAKAGYGHRLDDFPLDNPLTDGATYTLDAELRPEDGGELAALARLRITVGGNTTSNRNPQLPAPELQPNPVRDHLYVTGIRQGTEFIIYDLAGRTIRAGKLAGYSTVNVQDLKPGVYLLTMAGHTPARFVRQ